MHVNIHGVAVGLLILHTPLCVCLCVVLTELQESAVLTSRAAAALPRSVCQPAAADTHTDSGEHTAGLVQPETGDELSDMMTARHMSIKER